MLPGLYEAKALQQLRYFGLNISCDFVGLYFVVLHLCTSLLSNVHILSDSRTSRKAERNNTALVW